MFSIEGRTYLESDSLLLNVERSHSPGDTARHFIIQFLLKQLLYLLEMESVKCVKLVKKYSSSLYHHQKKISKFLHCLTISSSTYVMQLIFPYLILVLSQLPLASAFEFDNVGLGDFWVGPVEEDGEGCVCVCAGRERRGLGLERVGCEGGR